MKTLINRPDDGRFIPSQVASNVAVADREVGRDLEPTLLDVDEQFAPALGREITAGDKFGTALPKRAASASRKSPVDTPRRR
jgi:hypothetical protein